MPTPHKTDIQGLSEEQQQAFFESVLARQAEAARRLGAVTVDLDVATTRVRLHFAGDGLVPHLTPALSHLVVEPDREPDVTFHLWDTESSAVEMVPPPVHRECFTDRGDIWGMSSPRIRSAFNWSEFAVSTLDLETKRGVFWVRSHRHLPYWTRSSPLRTLFHWWMEANGAQLLHAAAVGDEHGALLITGKGGVGKSTTALACLASGMRYIADDYLIVRLEPEPRVYTLYATAKLDPGQLDRFPTLRPLIWSESDVADEKAVLRLHPAIGSRLAPSLPVKAVVTPRFAGVEETTFRPTSSVALQRAAAFTTMSQLPHAGRHTYEFLHRLVAVCPGLEIALGHDIARVPVAIARFLALPDEEVAALARRDEGDGERQRPLVTVIVPVYNGAHFIEDAVASVLAQRYPALEIIVVDDGSTDDLASAVGRLPIDVRLLPQENAGPSAARNRGVRDASGDLIAFLDVDDLWPEGNLELLLERMLRDPAIDVVHGIAQTMTYRPAQGAEDYIGNPTEAFPFYIGAGLYRRRAFESVGLFDPDLRFGEDTDWFARARERGIHIEHVDAITLFVRRHEGNMTRGKSLVDLNVLRVFKKGLDRRRLETGRNPA